MAFNNPVDDSGPTRRIASFDGPSTDIPDPTGIGDIWTVTDMGNLIRRWNGVQWEDKPLADAAIDRITASLVRTAASGERIEMGGDDANRIRALRGTSTLQWDLDSAFALDRLVLVLAAYGTETSWLRFIADAENANSDRIELWSRLLELGMTVRIGSGGRIISGIDYGLSTVSFNASGIGYVTHALNKAPGFVGIIQTNFFGQNHTYKWDNGLTNTTRFAVRESGLANVERQIGWLAIG